MTDHNDTGMKLILIFGILGSVAVFIPTVFIAKKRGVDVNSPRFLLTLFLGCVIITIIIPFLLFADMPFMDKIGAAIIALATGIIYLFVLRRGRQILKKK